MPNYNNAAEAQRQQMQSELFKALTGYADRQRQADQQASAQTHDMSKLAEQEAQGIRETDRNLTKSTDLLKSDPGYNVNITGGGGVALSKQRPEINPMGLLMAQQRRENDLDRKVHQYSSDYTKSNIPATGQTLQDVNNKITGGIAGKGELKSVGGWKNLIPGFAVGASEKLGVLPQGASDERASLQNLANVQIYDASGKAINESEASRLKEGMGWSPFTSPDTIRDAIRRYGSTVVNKGAAVEAGANPQAKAIAQERGIPSIEGLRKIIGSPQQPGRTVVKQQRQKSTGKIFNVYSDGTMEPAE